jgi:predicted DNA binding protein
MIVEAHASLDLLSTTRTALDTPTITVERFDTARSVPLRSVFWVQGAGDDDVADALADDETVADYRRLSTTADASLFRAYHPADASVTDLYDCAVSNDVLVLEATSNADAWEFDLWVPDRESLGHFRDRCDDAALSLSIHSMYNDEPQVVGDVYGLTEYQREILQLAVRRGYFTIPREVTLSELAAELDLSSQAASERLRRGIRTLVQTVLDDQSLDDREFDSDSR